MVHKFYLSKFSKTLTKESYISVSFMWSSACFHVDKNLLKVNKGGSAFGEVTKLKLYQWKRPKVVLCPQSVTLPHDISHVDQADTGIPFLAD